MKRNAPVLACFAVLAVIVGLVIWLQVSLWRECRADHSWFYCMRVLGK